MRKIINWKLYFVLLIISIFSIISISPYALTLQADSLQNLPIPIPLALLLSVLQSSVIFSILIFFGLKLSNKVGLGLPILESYIVKAKVRNNINAILKPSIFAGIIIGLIIISLDFLFIKIGVTLEGSATISAWKGFLASFYGGIGEEILLRLFFMTFIVWVFSKLTKSEEIIKNNFMMWLSIVLTALMFGLGHLPATASLTALTPIIVFRSLLLNGIGGIVFGWLYWKKGLESAMIAHFSADIMLHVVFVLIL
jgi:membrane protease YdiL (CAAX protease family)